MVMISNRPNPNEAFPNPKIPSLCFIKNVVKNPRIIIGDYTYYDDDTRVLHHVLDEAEAWNLRIRKSLIGVGSINDFHKFRLEE